MPQEILETQTPAEMPHISAEQPLVTSELDQRRILVLKNTIISANSGIKWATESLHAKQREIDAMSYSDPTRSLAERHLAEINNDLGRYNRMLESANKELTEVRPN